MKKFTQIAKSACPSKLINAWKLKINSKCYLITPAHVAVYRKNDQWLISKFLKDLSHYNWCIPVNYLANFAHEDDIAWTLLPDSESNQNFLELSNDKILHPTKVEFFFHQPYNTNGILVENSSFASINSVVYPSPESELLEALDVGFRGMSGALALKQETAEVVGMFVGRGTALGLKMNVELPDFFETKNQEKETIESYFEKSQPDKIEAPSEAASLKKYELAEAKNALLAKLPPDLQNVVKGFLEYQKILKEEGLDSLRDDLRSLKRKLDFLVQETLTKDDLNNLLSVAALRRGLIISNQGILQHILESKHMEIKSFAKLKNEQ